MFHGVNDIRSSLEYGKLVQYADFTTLCFSGRSNIFLEQNGTENLNSLVRLFHNVNFKTNALKSITFKSMYISHCTMQTLSVSQAETTLEEMYLSTFLGLYLIDFTLDEHELNLLKTNLRKSCFEKPIQILLRC